MTDSTTQAGPVSGRREWLGLAVLVLPALLVSLDLSILLVALPQISEQLGAGATEQLWIADVYGFVVAGLLVTAGTLGDRVGRRRLLVGAGAVFGTLSVLAAFASDPTMLIAYRALLGVAGAGLMPSALALAGGVFSDPRRAPMAMSVVFSAIMAGGALGPVLGGVLLNFFWWGSVFLVAVPVMVLIVVLGPKVLPEFSNPDAGRIDLASAALSMAGILLFVYAIKQLAEDGPSVVPVVALVAGIALGVLFVWRQLRLESPLLDMTLFASRPFTAALVFMLFGGIVMGGLFLVATQYLQLVAGLSPLLAGLAMLLPSLASTVGVLTGPKIATRIRPAFVMAIGMLVAALGLGASALLLASGTLLGVVAALTVTLFGMGLPGGLGLGMIIGSAPPEQAGSASSMSSTCQELGVAFGLAFAGSLVTAVYAGSMASSAPAGLPVDVAGNARTSLAEANASAGGLPDTTAESLLSAAREAFIGASQVTFGSGAVIALALAALVAAALRHVPASGAASETVPDEDEDGSESTDSALAPREAVAGQGTA